jgi:hypothetical protein
MWQRELFVDRSLAPQDARMVSNTIAWSDKLMLHQAFAHFDLGLVGP